MAIKSLHITNSWHAASGGISTFYRQLLAAANRHRRPLRLIVPGGRTYIEEVGEYGRIYVVEGVRAPLNAGYRLVMPDNYLFPGERPFAKSSSGSNQKSLRSAIILLQLPRWFVAQTVAARLEALPAHRAGSQLRAHG